jgi:nitrogen-specific signal transduction histidine kinase
MPRDEQRRIRGEQDVIVRYEPERALETLPRLLADPDDRKRLLTLFDRLLSDERFQSVKPTPEQVAMLDRINGLLRTERAAVGRLAAVRNESAG